MSSDRSVSAQGRTMEGPKSLPEACIPTCKQAPGKIEGPQGGPGELPALEGPEILRSGSSGGIYIYIIIYIHTSTHLLVKQINIITIPYT